MEFKNIQVSNLLSKFSQKCEPKKHVDSGHENKKSQKCRICDKSFSNKDILKNMLEKFMRLNNLKVAIRVVLKKIESNHHTLITSWNSKSSKCLICYQSFSQNVNLRDILT